MPSSISTLTSAAAALLLAACASSSSSGGGGPAAGGEPTEGPWNAADASAMARVFIGKCVEQAPWAETFARETGRKPTVQVGEVENQSEQAVDPSILSHEIESALLNNGSVQVSAGGTAAKDIMAYQANVMALDETASSVTAPTADFLVSTSFAVADTTHDGTPVMRYSANFRLLKVDGGTVACGASAEVSKLK